MVNLLIIALGIIMVVASVVDLTVKVKNNDPELDDFFVSP